MNKLLILPIVLCLFGCSTEEPMSKQAPTVKSVEKLYTIINKECNAPYKCSYDIRIKKKMSAQELQKIAREVKSNTPSVSNLFIMYYLPCMKVNSGAWATGNFAPELKVNINEYMLSSNPACL